MTLLGQVLWNLHRDRFWPSAMAKICHVPRSTAYTWIEQGVLIAILTRRPSRSDEKRLADSESMMAAVI